MTMVLGSFFFDAKMEKVIEFGVLGLYLAYDI